MRSFIIITFIFYFNLINGQDLNYVFKSGNHGYNCFRIPTIIKAKNGTILAFAEGRKKSCSDTGDVDLVYKKSFDNYNQGNKLLKKLNPFDIENEKKKIY